ncbi:MAG: hypothetical protein QGF46_03030, partial [Planctomycetota bacterium]|nr:hypothetical protein [Planctomycetota bacterium]
MIASAVLFCLSLLQSQQDEVTLTAATISSSDTEFGQSYELTQFELVSPIVSLRANRAVIELANSENSVTPPVSWANELVRGIGLSNTDFSIKSVSIEGNVLFSDSRLSISADLLSFSPATGTSEFKNLSATFESNTVGPNGWPVIINAERMLESPGQIIEFFECDFSTCLEETQHYSTSFSYLRATKRDDDKMFWQPQGAWLNIFGVPVLPLPAPDFVDGDDFFGLKGINFGSSRITGNQIVPQFGGRKIFDNGDEFNWNFD